jgi:autotransporter-associated beta strand protein
MKIAQNPFLRRGLTAAMTFPTVITAYADTALTTGNNIIDTTGNPALGVITRSTGDTAWFNNNGTATATGTPLVNGILGPWASIGTGTSTRFATLDGSNNVVSYTGTTDVAFGAIPNGGTGLINYRITSAGSVAYGSGTRNINTLTHSAGATTLTWGNAAGQINLVTNGVLNAGSGTLTLVGGGSNANSGVMIGANNNRELVVNAASAGISLGKIIDNTGGASSITIVGSGSNAVTFTGANTFTGPIRVLSGGTLNFGANQTISQTVIGAGSINNTGGTATVTGDFSGFTGTYTHNTTVASSVFNTAVSTSASASYVLASAQGSAQGFIAAGAGDYTLKMGSLSGVANSLIRGGNTATGTTTMEVGNLGTNTMFAGIIANGTTKTMALSKVGAGTLTLSGASTYNGATLVSSGTLLVNGSLGNTAVSVTGGTLGGSGAIAGTVTVSATLSPGTSIESLATGALTMASGSSYVFEVAGNSSTGADLVAVNGTLSLTDVSLDFDAATLAALASGSWVGGDKITLISYSGTGITSGFDGYADDTSYVFGSNEWTFNYNDTLVGDNFLSDATANGQNRFVTMTLVPEPGAALLGGLGLLALLRRRR